MMKKMQIRWVIFLVIIIYADTSGIEGNWNPVALFKILNDIGPAAWGEAIFVACLILTPSYLLTFLFDKYVNKKTNRYRKVISFVCSAGVTLVIYFLLMTFLNVIKHA